MKLSILFLFGFVFIQGSCYSQNQESITFKLIKTEFEQSASNMSAVIDEISYIRLETSSDVIVGGASNYHLKRMGDCFCIYHSRCNEAIMLFDIDGKFRCKVGGIGKGPGEYSGVFSVFFDKYLNNIAILQGMQIKLFDLQGVYLSTIDIPSNNTQIRDMVVVDQEHWMFTFFKPDGDDGIEAGVIMTDKKGGVIKRFSEFDSSIPGCNGKHALSNNLYGSGRDIYFCPFDYNRTYKFNGESWDLSYVIEDPFKKPPKSLYNSRRSELMKFKIDNGFLMSVKVNESRMIIEGSTPTSFNILIDLESERKFFSSYFMNFHMEGLNNDIDGGMPFYLSSIDDEGYSYNLIDSPKLIDYHSKNLLNPDGASHGEFMPLQELIKDTKSDDNPIIVVSHLKN